MQRQCQGQVPGSALGREAFDIGTGVFSHCPFTSEPAWAAGKLEKHAMMILETGWQCL